MCSIKHYCDWYTTNNINFALKELKVAVNGLKNCDSPVMLVVLTPFFL